MSQKLKSLEKFPQNYFKFLVHSSIDVVSSSSDTSAVQKPVHGRPQSTVPPRTTPTVRDHLRNSPVPMLPAPPRRDSRKGRKRPPCLESTAIGGVGGQIFPHLEPKGKFGQKLFENKKKL